MTAKAPEPKTEQEEDDKVDVADYNPQILLWEVRPDGRKVPVKP